MFPGMGNLINTAAVLIGSALGLVLRRGVPKRGQEILMQALGLSTIFIGLSGTLQAMFAVDDGRLSASGTLLLIFSLVLGAILGEAVNIEKQLDRLGDRLRRLAGQGENGRFTEGFVTASLILCVGAMAVVGGLSDGLGDPSTLLAKSILDFVVVLVFSSTLGVGVMVSALPLFLYQGLFNLVGLLAGNVMSDAMINGMSLVGNVLIFGVGVNLAFGKRLRVGNLLPALAVPVIWELLRPLFG